MKEIGIFGLVVPAPYGESGVSTPCFALVTEEMFAYPGMGKLIYDSIMGNDFNLAMVALLFATFMTLAGNLLADLSVGWLDPRIRLR